MECRQDHPPVGRQTPFSEVQPILDIVHHHNRGVESAKTESVAATETFTAQLRDLRNFSGAQRWSQPEEDKDDTPVTVRISHPETTDPSKNSTHEYAQISEKLPSQDRILTSEVDDESETWSSAVFDVDRTLKLFAQDTPDNQDGFVELNRFCYFCQNLCKTSRAFNAYVHEVDAEMPMHEPPNTWDKEQPRLPHREIQEYFDFWPSSSKMLASVQNGCHLCTIISQRLIERLDRCKNPEERFTTVPSHGPVKLVVCCWWSHAHQSASTSDLS